MAEDMDVDSRSILDVQREIDGVQEKIDAVEKKIDAVELQLSNEKDPEERKYLRDKKKQLRDEEKQLRDEEKQLRDEEKQLRDEKKLLLELLLRDKELFLLKSKAPIQAAPGKELLTREKVHQTCSGFWNEISERFPGMPREQDFKRSFHRSSKELYTLKNRVVLLLEGLKEGKYFHSSSEAMKLLKSTDLLFFVNASGSGKTRSLYELCCQLDCIYFTGVTGTGQGDEGSQDLHEVARKLAELYPSGAIPDAALEACVGAALVSRLFVLKEASSHSDIRMSRLVWLFKQVFFKFLNYAWSDVWLECTRRLLVLVRDSQDVEDARNIFGKMLHELKTDVKWEDGIVIVDECQEISRVLENRFRSETMNEVNRSMMDKLPLALQRMGFSRAVVSGTGRHVIAMVRYLSGSVKNRVSYDVYSAFGEFSSPDSLKEYTLSVLGNVEGFDFDGLFFWYKGRYRFYVTALEQFLVDSEDSRSIDPTKYLLSKADDIASLPGSKLKINRSVWDDVVKFFQLPTFHPGCFDVVVTLVVMCVYTGLAVKLAITDSDLAFVQAGIGRIRDGSGNNPLHFRPGFDFSPVTLSEPRLRTVEIGEPIVVVALWRFLTSCGEVQKKLINDMGVCSKSELGVKFEPYSATFLLQFLEKRAPVDFIPASYKNRIAKVYHQVLNVPKSNSDGLVEQMPDNDDGTTFLRWLERFEEVLKGRNVESFRPFLHSGQVTRFGPDMVAGFIGSADGKPVLSFFQHKLRKETNPREALGSLDVDDLFLHQRGNKRSEVEEQCVDKVKELVTQGGLMKWIVCVTCDVSNLRKNRVFDAAYDSVPKIHKGKRTYEKLKATTGLVGILDRNLQVLLDEDPWFVDAVRFLKEEA